MTAKVAIIILKDSANRKGFAPKTNIGLSTKQSEVQTSKVAQELFDENLKYTNLLLNSMPSNRDFIEKVHQHGLQKI